MQGKHFTEDSLRLNMEEKFMLGLCFSSDCLVITLKNDGGPLGIHVVPASDSNGKWVLDVII